ncbi:phage antirepressor KilAC domain-containing protein [Microbacterium sp. G2-8]|uniref:phage antirepressor KilAC domain-containing protein n=1 Tax=Microbacterium sp. G2-8 TaxID=2842454 RepID=UPI001C892A0F|nr:phage antirepressor KilAC domain-containing protein [Microbacterium sp. G2-8]
MNTLLQEPVRIIARWISHGDLSIVVDGDYVYLRADQLEQLADVPAWSSGETIVGDEWPADLDGVPFYTLDAAVAKVNEHAGRETPRQFLAWLNVELPNLLEPRVVEAARGDVSFVGAYPVASAARHLDRHPEISMGRDRLFAYLEHHGWIERIDDAWAPTTMSRSRGWVTVRRIPHPDPSRRGRALYGQIYITPSGLEQLRDELTPEPIPAAPDTLRPLFD